MARGLLVLGTDTGVGKTVVSALVLEHLRSRNVPTAALKPVETGCAPDPLDALALRAVTGVDDPLEMVCPYRFALPVAPEAAARAEGVVVDPGVIKGAFAYLERPGRFVLVESAGGAGTPYGRGTLALDLARMLDLPVLLVARAVLGTVGQTLLALRAIHHAGGVCKGVVMCRVPGHEAGPEDSTHVPLIEAHAGIVPVLGTLPLLDVPLPHAGSADDVRGWARANVDVLRENVDLDRLMGPPARVG